MTRIQAEQIVKASLDALFENDPILLENDVSERAITHKLAEYLQQQLRSLGIAGLSVDCEYNRNREDGPRAPKRIILLEQRREYELRGGLSEDDSRSVTTFPDIIIHYRGTNDRNTLIVEVKKTTSTTSPEFDFLKLKAFTDTERNPYHYEHGVFVLLTTGQANQQRPVLKWFSNGEAEGTGK